MNEAFGWPGLSGTWCSSRKDFVTTAIGGASQVWLTIGHGIGNEIYWPSTGQPQVRDVGFLVTANEQWTEVKRANNYTLTTPNPAVLVPTIVHHGDGWDLRLKWIVDPNRDVILIDYELTGEADGLYVLVAPHLGSGSSTNTAWADQVLHAVADQGEAALCVAADPDFEQVSVGFVGASDGWQDISQHQEMTWNFDRAEKGNVTLTAELSTGGGTLAIGFGSTSEGAAILAKASLAAGSRVVGEEFQTLWQTFASQLRCEDLPDDYRSLAKHSAAVLACHEDRTFPGAMVASLSVPWGNSRLDLGGYHLVWSRDCVECAFGRLAVGDLAAAERTLAWLCAAQQADGHWTQNSFPDGRPFWTGIQLDEVALPILLATALQDSLGANQLVQTMVQKAVQFLVAHGPVSPQDRWEENAGVNGFTLAVVISSLVAAGSWLSDLDRTYACSLADYWNERIEDWLYVEGGELCAGRDIAGYYVRMGDPTMTEAACGRVDVRNSSNSNVESAQLVACDFLALVRFGIRSPNDQKIVDTVKLIDDVLAVELPTGIAYRRYNMDGYGENADGSPFDGAGIGRPWPLLSGERGHYAAQANADYSRYLDSIGQMTGAGQLIPEQVWDAEPIPERFLEPGHPTGSAMPLAWAHAEYAKLATYHLRNRPIEQLLVVSDRFLAPTYKAEKWHWRVNTRFATVPAGRQILVDHESPFRLRIGSDEISSRPIGCGRHGVTIPPTEAEITFSMLGLDGVEIASGSVRSL